MTTTQISRDPFAREELHRRLIPAINRGPHCTCRWCGQPAKFTYEIHSDGGRQSEIPGSYCSVGCMRAYNT